MQFSRELIAEKIAQRCDRSAGPSACWPWTRRAIPSGYGKLRVAGKEYLAHRLAFFVAHGHWPEPMCCHRCDNPICVNPAHLFAGTAKDNQRDSIAKGRKAWGERMPHARLTEAIARQIFSDLKAGIPGTAVRRKYGISGFTLQKMQQGKRWARAAEMA